MDALAIAFRGLEGAVGELAQGMGWLYEGGVDLGRALLTLEGERHELRDEREETKHTQQQCEARGPNPDCSLRAPASGRLSSPPRVIARRSSRRSTRSSWRSFHISCETCT